MSTQTTKLHLEKPASTEFYSVAVNNANLDKIDEAIGSANGIAELDENGRVPYSQLPIFDVVNGKLCIKYNIGG